MGEYTTEGFVVHKGSKVRAEIVASTQGTSSARLRNQLALDGILSAQNGMLVFTRDHLFSSPSSAASLLMGRPANGWIEWKTDIGKTLDEVKRQGVSLAGA